MLPSITFHFPLRIKFTNDLCAQVWFVQAQDVAQAFQVYAKADELDTRPRGHVLVRPVVLPSKDEDTSPCSSKLFSIGRRQPLLKIKASHEFVLYVPNGFYSATGTEGFLPMKWKDLRWGNKWKRQEMKDVENLGSNHGKWVPDSESHVQIKTQAELLHLGWSSPSSTQASKRYLVVSFTVKFGLSANEVRWFHERDAKKGKDKEMPDKEVEKPRGDWKVHFVMDVEELRSVQKPKAKVLDGGRDGWRRYRAARDAVREGL